MTKGKDRGMPLFDRLVEYEVDEDRPVPADRRDAVRAPAARPGDRDSPMTVSAVLRAATGALDRGVGTVWLSGEVYEGKTVNGHLYFTLKDDNAQIACVMWRSDARRLRFRLEPGMSVLCRGRLGIYDVRGQFQFYAASAEPAGMGAEALALEQLKQALAAEGLFETSRKRPLPALPKRIGVVTSRTGAALRDIMRVIHRRYPVPILLVDTQVQGPDAPRQIALALEAMARQEVDVVIVGRGGGSAGDLSAFNDERVVRKVAAMPMPTISAVGHEVDVSLTDLVADARAATPSQAGELAVPVLADMSAALAKEQRRLDRELEMRLRSARQQLDQLIETGRSQLAVRVARGRRELGEAERRMSHRHPKARLAGDRATVRELSARATSAMQRCTERASRTFAELAGRIDAMSPLRVLDRGYAIATAGSRVLSSSDDVQVGDHIAVRLAAGSLDCRVEGAHGAEEDEAGGDQDHEDQAPGDEVGRS